MVSIIQFVEIMKTASTLVEEPPFDFDHDLALLQYTGGTTGSPKGVMLSHKNLISNATMCDVWLYKCKARDLAKDNNGLS